MGRFNGFCLSLFFRMDVVVGTLHQFNLSHNIYLIVEGFYPKVISGKRDLLRILLGTQSGIIRGCFSVTFH